MAPLDSAFGFRRHRVVYLGLAIVVVVLGLSSRRLAHLLPSVLGKYPGDALWALMVFLLIGACSPHGSTRRVAATALGLSFAVEFLQLYQAPWITAIRQTTLGHLVLGSHFHALDLLAYTVGVGLGWVGEWVYLRLGRAKVAPEPSRDGDARGPS